MEKIIKKTTVQKVAKNSKGIQTPIPAIVRDVLHLHDKDKVTWQLNLKNMTVKFKKQEK